MSRETRSFNIEGMHCAGCSAAVERSLNALDGVTASVNLPAESTTITFDPDLVPFIDLSDAVLKAGYRLSPPRPGGAAERERVQVQKREERTEESRLRMIIAWSMAGPVAVWMLPEMLFHISWPSPFTYELGILLLALPVLAWPGRDTMVSGFVGLRRLRPNMDTLIALGSGAAVATGFVAVSHQFGFDPASESRRMVW